MFEKFTPNSIFVLNDCNSFKINNDDDFSQIRHGHLSNQANYSLFFDVSNRLIKNQLTLSNIDVNTTIDKINNSKHSKSTFPFGKCKVCNDEASGVHYGISTCEGCKGFFKRCTIRKEKYRCFFGNNCSIMPDNRNKCKACRFRKCLDVGMSLDGIKMGRIPKAEKERALMNERYLQEQNLDNYVIVDDNSFDEPSSIFNSPNVSNDSSTELSNSIQTIEETLDPAFQSLIKPPFKRNSVSYAQPSSNKSFNHLALEHVNNNTNSIKIDKQISSVLSINALVENSLKTFQIHTTDINFLVERANSLIKFNIREYVGNDATVYDAWEGLVGSTARSIRQFINYCRDLYGFSDLSQKDLGKIISSKLLKFYMIKFSPLFINGECYVLFPNDMQYSKKWMKEVVGKDEVVDKFFEFCDYFRELNLRNDEIALLLPFVFTTQVNSVEHQVESIQNLHGMYAKAMIHQMNVNRRDFNFREKFTKLMEKLEYIDQIYIKNVCSLKPLSKN